MPVNINLISFDDAMIMAGDSNKYLLLGNGFSIAIKPDIFDYASLYTSADFTGLEYVREIFTVLNTKDFEAVIKTLVAAARMLRTYAEADEELIKRLESDANRLKEILVRAVAEHHPDRPNAITDDQYKKCRDFLSKFKCLYTVNYDVILYWTLMHIDVDELKLPDDDGFRNPEEEGAIYVSWQEGHKAEVHYLHGALHLYDAGHEIVKYTWSRTEVAIVDQVRAALQEERYPIFVAEGESNSKLQKIMHSAYLHKSLRSFEASCDIVGGSLFIYGHSLDSTDDHIFQKISDGKIRNVYIGTRGDMNSEKNIRRIQKAQEIENRRAEKMPRHTVNIQFYNSDTVQLWS